MEAKCKMSDGATTWPCAARWCPLYHDCLCEYESRAKRPPTNADRIRAMGDAELAKCLAKTFLHGYGQLQLLDWLHQPAMEGSDG